MNTRHSKSPGPESELLGSAHAEAIETTMLLDRRAELMGAAGTQGPEGPRSSDLDAELDTELDSELDAESVAELDAELDALTQTLRDRLSSQPPLLRRLAPGADQELIERLASIEPVHPLDDPSDIAEVLDRVAPDRRCFVLEHPLLPGRPMNVVWVALCVDPPGKMADLLGPERVRTDPSEARTAVFYSIWSIEPGLVGIPGGSTLLGFVLEALQRELPALATFTTMSPIPGFRQWLDHNSRHLSAGHSTADTGDNDQHGPLLAACARYLCSLDDRGRPIDPVARFHMRNGARLWRIIPEADPSDRGISRSLGIMANYRYSPEDRPANANALSRREPVLGSQVEVLLSSKYP